jgi:Domain of unknown function (DUF1887).
MGDFPLQPGHFRCQPDDFLAQRGDPIPQRMNECVFLRVRQVSKIGQSFHAAYCQLSFPFLNPDQRLFYGEPEQLPCKFLGKHIADPNLQTFIGAMNRLVDRALENIPGTYEERLVAPDQAFETVPFGIWAKALGELMKAGLITWQDGSPDVTFTSVEAARFVRGGWLKEYAWHTVKDAGAFDTRLSVEGVWADTQKTINEFDVLACHINQLLFIEYKTPRIGPNNENDIAYKLKSLSQDARGLFGDTWLLSARQPSEVLIERAKQARFRLIGPDELANLRELVLDWLSGRD